MTQHTQGGKGHVLDIHADNWCCIYAIEIRRAKGMVRCFQDSIVDHNNRSDCVGRRPCLEMVVIKESVLIRINPLNFFRLRLAGGL